MSELLQELVGRRVWFWTTVGPSDLGTLDAAGNRWISMTSAVNGLLLLPLANIRLIKSLAAGWQCKRYQEKSRLLYSVER